MAELDAHFDLGCDERMLRSGHSTSIKSFTYLNFVQALSITQYRIQSSEQIIPVRAPSALSDTPELLTDIGSCPRQALFDPVVHE